MVKNKSTAAIRLFTPMNLVTLLVSAATLLTVLAQITYTRQPEFIFGLTDDDDYRKLALPELYFRAVAFGRMTDPVERDAYCIPLSSTGRNLDRDLPPDARIFVSGVLGTNRGPQLAVYYFLRNYMFPRDIVISLGPVTAAGDDFLGVPGPSRSELKTNGFDILIRLGDHNAVDLIPLTAKGALKKSRP